MRGTDVHQEGLFSYLSPESRIPQRHPLRPVREMVDIALSELSGQFESMYSDTGRRSIPPEKLLRALLLQILYSIRSERMLCEQLDYNLLFRWFIGLSMDDPVWDHSTFSKNRDRLLESDIARGLFDAILAQAEARDLTSDEHFTVDGTLIEAWASLKSVRAKDGSDDPPEGGGRNPERDFHGQKRKNDTHESSTDPESRLYRKGRGKEARFYYMGHVLMENRHGLVVDGDLTKASGTAERDDAARLPAGLVPRLRRILFRLQEATHPGSADASGFRLHPLNGDRTGQWSVRVSGELARGVPLRGRRGRGPDRLSLTGRER